MEFVIGIGEYAISDNEDDILKTFALGSCIAVTIYSPRKKVLGLVHIALPCSNINTKEKYSRPGHYADTAVPLLLDKFERQYKCNKGELVVNIFGGADSTQQNDVFKIGKRNVEAVKSILAKHCIVSKKEETGGKFSRNVEADVATGTVKLGTFYINGINSLNNRA